MKMLMTTIFCIMSSLEINAIEFSIKSMGKLVRNEITIFPDGSKFISFNFIERV